MKKVVILGGGVAGLSAAHELAERGFTVSVYERRDIPGGKARSVPVPDTGTEGRPHLPGEHGFRFFPGFYRHVTDTMKRIPYGQGGRSVYDNLVDSTRIEILQSGRRPLITLARFPTSLADLIVLLKALESSSGLGLKDDDVEFFATRLWQILTSCEARRMDEYERIGWWDFIGAGRRSLAYQELLAGGLSRTLVAAQPKLANTRTGGDILLQLLFNICAPGVSCDRVLNGPTNDVWINPWCEHLARRKVEYHPGTTVTAIHHKDQKITGVTIQQGSTAERTIEGDYYYVAALPVEAMGALLRDTSKGLLDGDPTLEGIIELSRHTAWMNGIQFYLKEDVPLAHGHQLYVDSPWAITSLSQQQFWQTRLCDYGDGTVNGILSVDVSDWKTPGIVYKKPAIECSASQIKDEVWEQLKQGLNVGGEKPLKDNNLRTWFLDPDILAREYMPRVNVQLATDNLGSADLRNVNLEPLLVNEINTWHLRPNAYTRICNLFLAADYVRTNTDLATMEGANEAARRAVNAIIDASGSRANYCRVWALQEPWVFGAWRQRDQSRYDWGLPWREEVPWKLSVRQVLRVAWANVRRWLRL